MVRCSIQHCTALPTLEDRIVSAALQAGPTAKSNQYALNVDCELQLPFPPIQAISRPSRSCLYK